MALKVEKRKVLSTNPKIMLLYGAPKVGKTTLLSQLDGCLILDTEEGSRMIEGHILGIDSREDLLTFYKDAEEGHEFKYIALDTIDKIIEWTEKAVCAEYQVANIADLAYGKGFGIVREKVLNNVKKLSSLCENVIIIGHRKTAAAVENSTAVDPQSLDISGKLKNMLMAMADAVGFVHRDDDNVLKISFEATNSLEAGSRCPHLRGQVIDFDWKLIYK
tara:strand:- start:2139 stop:2795 length:657 start_codon:yes stop_codon:yes gene_type:complete